MKFINNNGIKIDFIFVFVLAINGCMMMGMGLKNKSIGTSFYSKVQSINSNDSIDRVIDEVVLNFNLIETNTGVIVWSKTTERKQ